MILLYGTRQHSNKQAMALMANPPHDEPVNSIIDRLNLKHSLIGTRTTLTRSTLYRAVSQGNHGVQSPSKKGPQSKIPDVLVEVVATHAQVSRCSEGEMRGREIKRLIGAAILGTPYNNQFTIESVWQKVGGEFPEHLQAGAASKMSVDDARAQWTSYI